MVARVIAGGVFFLSLVLGILRKKGYLGGKSTTEITFLHQGGPIIFSQSVAQIENEYGTQAKQLGAPGHQYATWAVNMGIGLDTGVPWVMCKEEDAPDPVHSV
ncbi:hypothetical protein ACS0TY_035412 [Phlomoides rotata]